MPSELPPHNQDEAAKYSQHLTGDAWELPSDLKVVEFADGEVEKRLAAAGWDEGSVARIGMGIHEAFINAIQHGSKESPEKPARVSLSITPEEVRVTVRDEGPGFDWKKVSNPTEEENLMKVSGRGIFLMRRFFDAVEFNEAGNEVTLIKRKPKAEGGA